MKFDRIHIEISNICNLQCSFCPEVEREKKRMALDFYESLLLQAIPLTDWTCLHLMGEPLTHPDILQVLQINDKHNAKIQLTTNAILLGRYKEELINSKSLRQINFSVQSFKDNFPDKDIFVYLKSLCDFSNEFVASSTTQAPRYINFRLWNLESDSQDLNSEIINYLSSYFAVAINSQVDTSFRKSKKIKEGIYLHFDDRFDWPSMSGPVLRENGFCHALQNHFAIHADGKIVACCLDKEANLQIGDAKTQSLLQAIESEKAKKIRHSFSQAKICEELCKRCDFIQRFDKKAQKILQQKS